MHSSFQVQYIAQRIKDIELLFKLRAADTEEKKEIIKYIGPFRSAVLMKLYWHMSNDELLILKHELKNQYSRLYKQSTITSD